MGAGKSVVLEMFRELGADTLRADDASRELLAHDARLIAKVVEGLGAEVRREDGSLDRTRAAAIIFSDDKARRRLEAIMHRPMVRWLRERLDRVRARENPPTIVVLEAAVLTHMGARPLVDAVVRVYAPRETCIARLQQRDGLAAEDATARLRVHERLGLFTEPADHLLDASGTIEDTRRRTRGLWDTLVRRQASGVRRQ
jgi:dephospho-CoA kinase